MPVSALYATVGPARPAPRGYLTSRSTRDSRLSDHGLTYHTDDRGKVRSNLPVRVPAPVALTTGYVIGADASLARPARPAPVAVPCKRRRGKVAGHAVTLRSGLTF